MGEKAERAYIGAAESLVNDAKAKICYLAGLRDFGGCRRIGCGLPDAETEPVEAMTSF